MSKLTGLCAEDKAKVAALIRKVVDLGQELHHLKAKHKKASRRAARKKEGAQEGLKAENASLRTKLKDAFVLLQSYERKVVELQVQSSPHCAAASKGRRHEMDVSSEQSAGGVHHGHDSSPCTAHQRDVLESEAHLCSAWQDVQQPERDRKSNWFEEVEAVRHALEGADLQQVPRVQTKDALDSPYSSKDDALEHDSLLSLVWEVESVVSTDCPVLLPSSLQQTTRQTSSIETQQIELLIDPI